MEAIACLIALSIGIILGYYLNLLSRKIKSLEVNIKQPKKMSPSEKLEKELAKSTLIDMSDPIQLAKFQHDETLRQLNPHLYENDEDL